MPYSGASDPNLPANVKKMPAKKRRQWASIFNSTMSSCTGDDCEGKAFRIANGVLKRQKDMDEMPVQCECGNWNEMAVGVKDFTCSTCHRGMKLTWPNLPEQEDEDGEKCYNQPEITYYRPYGGATSFDEIDAYHEDNEIAQNISVVKYGFDSIYENIQSDPEMSPEEKISAVETATKEMIRRMQHPQQQGIGEKIKDLIFGSAG